MTRAKVCDYCKGLSTVKFSTPMIFGPRLIPAGTSVMCPHCEGMGYTQYIWLYGDWVPAPDDAYTDEGGEKWA